MFTLKNFQKRCLFIWEISKWSKSVVLDSPKHMFTKSSYRIKKKKKKKRKHTHTHCKLQLLKLKHENSKLAPLHFPLIDNSEVFGFLVSIIHNSKMVGPMTQKLVWISIALFPIFVSITQFSDFWVMSYGNWKHILAVFSFHNSIFNGIFIIKTRVKYHFRP